MVTITIDGKQIKTEEGQNVLQVALDNGINIPHLCYHENLSFYGGCRLCLVEVTKANRTRLTASCTYPALEGITVETNTENVKKARRLVMEMILPMAPDSPKLQALASELGITEPRFHYEDPDGCINCGLCVRACEELVSANAITLANRGDTRSIEPPFQEEPLACIGCAACLYVCPTDCIKMEEKGNERRIVRWERKLEMKTCANCKRHFMPLAQIEFAMHKVREPLDAGWFDNCPDCR